MIRSVKKFDKWLHSHLLILLALTWLIFLRIPNFFEPYWYGDEAIYLTIGEALRDGERLYTEIVDHKTPIIYYLAAVPNQFSFRVLNLAWMIVASLGVYKIGQKIFKSTRAQAVTLFTFVSLTSLPWFEGNIPNGELFVMGFTLVGGWILIQTRLFDLFLEKKETLKANADWLKIYLAGVFLGLAVMTKVPAVFDVATFAAVGWFALTNRAGWLTSKKKKDWWQLLQSVFVQLVILGAGVLTPLVLSILYFVAVGSGADYLQFGLLYNFRYASNWGLPFDSLILVQLFTLQAKVAIAGSVVLLLTLRKKWFSPAFQLMTTWFVLSLVGALLSNRPYPHYFQQLVPPLAFMVGLLVATWEEKKSSIRKLTQTSMGVFVIGLGVAALVLLDFGAYPSLEYYRKTFRLWTGQTSLADYRQSFNYFMTDNYQAAEIIKQSGVDEIFIWGTNPMLYTLSQTQPTGRFTVSFHIKDLGVYEETMADVRRKEPEFIVVMADENEELPGLAEYLDQNYILNSNYETFNLWMRINQVESN